MHLKQIYPGIVAFGVAVFVLFFGMAFVKSSERQHMAQHRQEAARLANEYGRMMQLQLDRSLDAGRMMAVALENQGGDIDAVDMVAEELIRLHGGKSRLGISPNYVIARVYPGEANQEVVGLDLMSIPLRRSQIRAAIRRGAPGLSGPQTLASGAVGFVSDVPVTIGQDDPGNWGVVTVAFELGELIESSGVERLAEIGYDYIIVSEQPGSKTAEPALIASSFGLTKVEEGSTDNDGTLYDLVEPVSTTIGIPNGSWGLYISPVSGWGSDVDSSVERTLVLFFSILISLFIFEVLRRPAQMEQEVANATRELGSANRLLQDEVIRRGEAESALRQSELRALAILRNAGDAIITVDEMGAILDYNPAASRIFGYPGAQLLSKSARTLIPDLADGRMEDYFAGLGEGDSLWSGPDSRDFRGQNSKGRPLDLEIALSRVKMQEGWLYTLIIRNHTARNRAERALRETRAQLDYVISRAPVVVFVLDEKGVFTLSEGRGLARLGRNPSESVGRSIFDVYPDIPAIHDAVRTTLQGEAQSLVIRMGRTVFDVWYSPRLDDTGNVVGLFGVAYDVTELKEAEEALWNVINTVFDGVVTADATGKIVLANQRMAEILGYDPAGLKGQPLTALFSPEEHDRVLHCLENLRSGRVVDSMERVELAGIHKEGQRLMLQVHIAQTHVGEQSHFTASINDISKQKELAQMREDFISTVSHELRTPLAALIGWLDTLMSERPGPLTVDQRRFLNIALSGAERLNGLVEEILTVAKLTEGKLQLRRVPFDPHAVLANTVTILSPLAESQSVEFAVQDEWPVGKTVEGDRGRLEQVVTNLLNNAIKFSPDGGTVTVHSSYREGCWRLEVRDEGIGIPLAEMARLYERFYRATNVRNTHLPGTGLGLYVSKSIVEAHNGQIGHRSVNGSSRGTVAWFSIPIVPREAGESIERPAVMEVT